MSLFKKLGKKNKVKLTNKLLTTDKNIKTNNKLAIKPKAKKTNNKILAKSKNTSPIRVLYKKEGQLAEVKIIDNVFRLKKAILTKNLSIIPYETLYIICNNKNLAENMEPNIVLNFSSIYGDLILVDIDKKNREFKGLTQEDIIWYSKDLNRKSFNSMKNNINLVVNSVLKNGDINNE